MLQKMITPPFSCYDVCAVITTYRPDKGFPDRVRLVEPQVGCVVIVDDSGSLDVTARLHSWFSNKHNIALHNNVNNEGIGVALNNGISVARLKGYQWVLTLDDDTTVEPDMVENLIDSWRKLERHGGKPIAIMGMAYRDSNTGEIEQCVANGHLFEEKRGILTSGTILSLSAYEKIGHFREEFFIDSVDYDFCLRARAKGLRVVKVCSLGMTHSLGDKVKHRFGWLTLETTDHTPVRRYYMFRNSTILACEYFFRDPLYSLAVIWFQWKTLALVILMEKNRYRKVRLMWRGVLDAWRRRMGKYSGRD